MSKIHTPTTINKFINLFNRQEQYTPFSYLNGEKRIGLNMISRASEKIGRLRQIQRDNQISAHDK